MSLSPTALRSKFHKASFPSSSFPAYPFDFIFLLILLDLLLFVKKVELDLQVIHRHLPLSYFE